MAWETRMISWTHRRGIYETMKVRIPHYRYPHEVEITVSPTHRSVQVHVDGVPFRKDGE